jgi:hypothetical protein
LRIVYHSLLGIVLLVASILVAFSMINYFFNKGGEGKKILESIGKEVNSLKPFEIKELPNYPDYYLLYNPYHMNYNNIYYSLARDPFSYSCKFDSNSQILYDCKDFFYFYTTDDLNFYRKISNINEKFSDALKEIKNFCKLDYTDSSSIVTNILLNYKEVLDDYSHFYLCYAFGAALLSKFLASSLAKKSAIIFVKKIESTFFSILLKSFVKKLVVKVALLGMGNIFPPFEVALVMVSAAWTGYDIYDFITQLEEFNKLKEKIMFLLISVPYKDIENLINFIEISEDKRDLINYYPHSLFLCKSNKEDNNCEILNTHFKLDDTINYVTGKLVFYFPFYENAFLLKNKIITKIPVDKNRYLILIVNKSYKEKLSYFFSLLKSNSYSDFLDLTNKYSILVNKKDGQIMYYILYKTRKEYPSSFIEVYYEPNLKIKEKLKFLENEIKNLDLNKAHSYIYKEKYFYFNEKTFDELFDESFKCFKKVIEENKLDNLKLYEKFFSKIKNKEKVKEMAFIKWFLDYTHLFMISENKDCIKVNEKLNLILKEKLSFEELFKKAVDEIDCNPSYLNEKFKEKEFYFLSLLSLYLDFYLTNCKHTENVLDQKVNELANNIYRDYLCNKRNEVYLINSFKLEFYCSDPKIKNQEFIKFIDLSKLAEKNEINKYDMYLSDDLLLREQIFRKTQVYLKEDKKSFLDYLQDLVNKLDKLKNNDGNQNLDEIQAVSLIFESTKLYELYEIVQNKIDKNLNQISKDLPKLQFTR